MTYLSSVFLLCVVEGSVAVMCNDNTKHTVLFVSVHLCCMHITITTVFHMSSMLCGGCTLPCYLVARQFGVDAF